MRCYDRKTTQAAASDEKIARWRTYTSRKARQKREYVGSALNAGGNQCRCILVRSSSLSICVQMNIVRAVIVG